MVKKELPTTIRQMHGFDKPRLVKRLTIDDKPDFIPISATAKAAYEKALADFAKDKLIAELRASLAQLEAADKSRRAKQRDRTAKVRAKK